MSNDIQLLYPALFGNGLVLTPHTYLLNAATIFTDTLFLDAEGNSNAVFVIKINGALSTSINSKVILLNGASAKNIFWKVEGAADISNNSEFKGTLICNNGAINLAQGTILIGKAFTTTGALSTNNINAYSFSTSTTNDTVCLSALPFIWNAQSFTTAGLHVVHLTNVAGCDSSATLNLSIDSTGRWLGYTNNYQTNNNWCGGLPTLSTDIIIPIGAAFMPLLSGIGYCRKVTLALAATLTVQGTLNIGGAIIDNANITASAGTIAMAGNTAQTIPALAFASNEIYNLTINNGSPLNYGE